MQKSIHKSTEHVRGYVKIVEAHNGGTKGHSKPTGNTHAGPPPPPQPKQQITKK